jgi:hypothetical protein
MLRREPSRMRRFFASLPFVSSSPASARQHADDEQAPPSKIGMPSRCNFALRDGGARRHG